MADVANVITEDLRPVHSVPRPSSRIPAYDGVRGVAALMVLFHHALLMLPDFANNEWGVPGSGPHNAIEWVMIRTPLRLFWAGQERALLFFVLSGFVLGLPWLSGKSVPYGRFLLGRFCRIYPPYIIIMALAAAGSMIIGGHHLAAATVYFNQLGWAHHPTAATWPSIAGILDNPSSEYMNEAVWTLVWEVRVALIFPLLMIPIIRWRNIGVLFDLIALALCKHLAAHVVTPWATSMLHAPQDTFYYAEYFIFGATVAANRVAITQWFKRFGEWMGLSMLAVGCLICWAPWPVQHDQIVGLGAAVILASILGSRRAQAGLSIAPLLWVGRQSYSLYLIHVPLIMAFIIACNGTVPLWVCGLVLPTAMVLAWVVRNVIEAPSVAITQRLTGYTKRGTSETAKRPPRVTQGWRLRFSRIGLPH